MEKNQEEGELKKNFFAYFLLFFPTLILAAIPKLPIGNFSTLSLQVLIIFYQFVVIKNFVDRYYGD